MTNEEIHRICSEYGIENYTINDDKSIDVNGNVKLYDKNLKEIPLIFRNVTGYFNCYYNELTSLKGGPSYVSKWFDCSYNKLTSLEGAPSSVAGEFIFEFNPLESLKGIPLNITENLLYLPDEYTYSDYLEYCNIIQRDLKFKKLLK